MNNESSIDEDEKINLTDDERAAFRQMSEDQINAYWQAQQSYEAMKAYLEHPDTPDVAKAILDLSGWQEHNQ